MLGLPVSSQLLPLAPCLDVQQQVPVQVREEEAGVGVVFHQAVHLPLSGHESAAAGFCQALQNAFFGVVVQIDLHTEEDRGLTRPCFSQTLVNIWSNCVWVTSPTNILSSNTVLSGSYLMGYYLFGCITFDKLLSNLFRPQRHLPF